MIKDIYNNPNLLGFTNDSIFDMIDSKIQNNSSSFKCNKIIKSRLDKVDKKK